MQFRVPQFIDIEDKILGPLTWKQTSYSLGAVGIFYIVFRFIDSKILALLVSSPFIALFLSLAFVKINGRPFVDVLEHAFEFYTSNNLFTWQRNHNQTQEEIIDQVVHKPSDESLLIKKSDKSLKDLSLDLDIKVDNQ